MNIKIGEKELKYIENLLKNDETNKIKSDFYLEYLQKSKKISKNYQKKLSFFDNIIHYFYYSTEFINFLKSNKIEQSFHLLDEKKYLENPYVQNIHLTNIKEGNYEFKLNKFNPYEGFIYKDIDIDNDYLECTSIGYFQESFFYPSLLDHQNIWMLITPHEMNTMEKAIENATGNVITFGLGLGYFAYMCSLKENVKSITIIEKDENIIHLFEKHILPQFHYKDKIKIIHEDALIFIQSKDFDYSYAFIDLYKDVEDGLPLYIKMKQAATCHFNTQFDYWIEKSMLIMLRRCFILLLYEEIYAIDNHEIHSTYDWIIVQLKKLLNTTCIKTIKDIQDLLSFDTIKKLILKLQL